MLSINSRAAFSPNPRLAKHGFTLIELLMVIAVIMILASITFGVFAGVKNAQSRTAAKAELAVIAQALEQFKLRNGDYPLVDGAAAKAEANGKILFEALAGWMEFSGSGNSAKFETKTSVPASGPIAYIDRSKLTYVDPTQPDELNPEIDLSNAPRRYVFLDPWGNPYVYLYGKSAVAPDGWEMFGYHLYSRGADGVDGSVGLSAATGIMTPSHREADENVDNIYSGE